MNELMQIKETMSSLQIAEITGKEHKHVMRDVRALLEQGVNESNFGLVEYTDKKGERRPCYELTKKGCLILASGYDAKLREKIIDRWEELETKVSSIESMISNPDFAIKLLTNLKEERQQRQIAESKALLLEQVTIEQAPKVAFANAMEAAKTSCLVGELAKILTQNGYTVGQNRLFKWLRDNHFLGTKGENYNIPYQTYIESGLFELKKGMRSGNYGVIHHTTTVKVTGKGQSYFINKLIRAA